MTPFSHGSDGHPTSSAREREVLSDMLSATQILTPRQTEVVRLAVLGLTAKETARRLGISKNTVDEHLQEARRRVGAASKSRLIGWAISSGAVQL
ncbi:response regulator transcription factor [Streptomyces sp. NPDC001165]|uniref:response regulator transcription factor n=1 Tax=Streptomyces sp. NPDC001165 TaxID=3364546 RepID=UPI0036A8BAEE